jgi:hypothetical protein
VLTLSVIFTAVVMSSSYCRVSDDVHLIWQPWIKEQNARRESIFCSLGDLMHSIKFCPAKEINQLKDSRGEIWDD